MYKNKITSTKKNNFNLNNKKLYQINSAFSKKRKRKNNKSIKTLKEVKEWWKIKIKKLNKFRFTIFDNNSFNLICEHDYSFIRL